MTPLEVGLIVFACVVTGTALGMLLRATLPANHLDDRAKSVIQLTMGLIATITALVLGLVTASAKSSYDAQVDAVKHTAAKILLLDRVLTNYGPETREVRALLKALIESRVDAIWPPDRFQHVNLDAPEGIAASHDIESRILQLSPQNDVQRLLRSEALQIGGDIIETRWLILGHIGASVPTPFLVVVVFWLAIIFGSFGLFAPRNGTVLGVLLLCALSVSSAIFLILEMDQPFEGLMRISSAPMRYALSHLSP